MILSLLSTKLLVPKYPELATEIIQSAMTDPVRTKFAQKKNGDMYF